MKKYLQNKVFRLRNDLESLLSELAAYPEPILQKQPAPGKWSVIQVLQHVMLAEQLSLQYLGKKLQNPVALKPSGLAGPWHLLLLRLFMALPIKVKAPAIVNEENFAKQITFAKLSVDWQQLRDELAAKAESIPPELLNTLLYRHTYAGRLPLRGMLVFFDGHCQRHRKQIRQTLRMLNEGNQTS